MIHFRKIPQIDYYDTPGRPAYQRHNLETLPFCFERTTFSKKQMAAMHGKCVA